MNTTLNRIHDSYICKKDEALLLHRLGKTKPDNEPLSIATILRLTDLKIATHCLRTVSGHDDKLRLFAIELLQPLRANVPREHQHLFDRTMQLATDYANNKVNLAILKASALLYRMHGILPTQEWIPVYLVTDKNSSHVVDHAVLFLLATKQSTEQELEQRFVQFLNSVDGQTTC